MEQITREEMIGLIDKASGLLCFYGEDKLSLELDEAIAALQAAEPVAWIGEEELDGLAMHRRNDFPAGAMVLAIKAGSAVVPLFTLPCPPATELAPESWREELETIAEILEADGDEWNCAARIRKMLTASPAPDHIPDTEKMAEALKGLLAIISDSRGVDGYHLNGDIAEWDEFEEVGFAVDVYAAHIQQEGAER